MADIAQRINVKAEAIDDEYPEEGSLTLDGLVLLVTTERVHHLEEQIRKEFQEVKKRQEEVRFLHELMKAINADTDVKGRLDWSDNPERQELLNKAREMGIDIEEGKYTFTKEEQIRLVDNIKMTTDDLNMQNEMQLQTISRLTNERYESYQMARSIMKPLHDAKVNMARKLSG